MNKTYLSLVGLVLAMLSTASGLEIKQGPLMTQWSAKVSTTLPLPEYPRPQMVRADWLNLNGVWDYQPGVDGDAIPSDKKLSSEILVPFPVESALSGVMEHHDRLWYRRSFEVPGAWKGRDLLLHFGAVDYESEVFVNGKSAGIHKGGYDSFTYNITPYLKDSGPQELVVKVYDLTDLGGQPRGKQTTKPRGIMYTPTTGIWQTVWLEPVSKSSIQSLHLVPDIDAGKVSVTVEAEGGGDAKVSVTVKDGASVVKTVEGTPGKAIEIPIPKAKLWSPDSPFLYDLEISLKKNGVETDKVGSYFGMRKISLGEENGIKKLFLNNKFVFQFGPLDQGFWPDGIYTAPTEEALKFDIQQMKALGFNMVRKHIKVEPARWYYWTDKLGLLVWQDMPSANSYLPKEDLRPPVDTAAFESELHRLIKSRWNSPSIVMWVTFNESQGQSAFDTPKVVKEVKALDPSRLVNEASGDKNFEAGDVSDIHSYPPPRYPKPSATQALACGEYGGIGYGIEGHIWGKRVEGYTKVTTPEDYLFLYSDFTELIRKFRDENGMSAAVYTQITDVEDEMNGLLTYDRLPKVKAAEIARINHFQFPKSIYTAVVETSEKESQLWKYTEQEPKGNWKGKDFDDTSWTEGKGGFGGPGPANIGLVGTPWKSKDIWLRKKFTADKLTAEEISSLIVKCYHDEDVEIFLNGKWAYDKRGAVSSYGKFPMSKEARAAFVSGGENILSVRCKQTQGGQYIDVGLFTRKVEGN